jgi:hypothetical protein
MDPSCRCSMNACCGACLEASTRGCFIWNVVAAVAIVVIVIALGLRGAGVY